jgi:eukaryotic-like serine/threonine-protein kinase
MFTMELVAGVSFLSWTRPGGVVSHDRLVPALAQLSAGVASLHRMRIVHRDLKPSNVLVTADGAVKILDFGLVTDASGEHQLTGTGGIVGTVAYMAPEQAAGNVAGPPADYWALGAMLYQALSGRLPHEGAALDVMAAKQTRPPPAPRVIAPDTPPELNALCMHLLAVAPDDRAGDDDVQAALLPLLSFVAIDDKHAGGGEGVERAEGARAPPLGRAVELAALEKALDASRKGPTLALILGESGIGKSTLLSAFLGDAERTGALGFSGRCHEREAIPYRAMDGAIDALGNHLVELGQDGVRRVAPRRTELLLRLFPVLGQVPGFGSSPSEGPHDSDAGALYAFAALRELFAALAERAVVIAIDDIQWADDDSLALSFSRMPLTHAPRVSELPMSASLSS